MTNELLDKVIDIIPRLENAAYKLLNVEGSSKYNHPLGVSSDGCSLWFDVDSKMVSLCPNDLVGYLNTDGSQFTCSEMISFSIQHIHHIMSRINVLTLNGHRIKFDALDVNKNEAGRNVLYADSIQLNTVYELPLEYLLSDLSIVDYLYNRAWKKKQQATIDREFTTFERESDIKYYNDYDSILTMNDLCNRYNAGEPLRSVCFCDDCSEIEINSENQFFSQSYPSPFEIGGEHYFCVEQYVMAEKARLFNDKDRQEKIINSSNIEVIRQLAQQINGFDEAHWNRYKGSVVRWGNVAKFADNKNLFEGLIRTDNAILVNTNFDDLILGVRIGEQFKMGINPQNLKDENIVGFTLMKIRDLFSEIE